MAIDPAVLERQRAVLEGVAEAAPRAGIVPMTGKLCPRCRERFLAVKNTSGVCYVCWGDMSKRARDVLRGESWRVRRPEPKRADADTIARARAQLAAKGIVVPEAA